MCASPFGKCPRFPAACQILIDFETDPNLLALQDSFSEEFFTLFEKGVQVRARVSLLCTRRALYAAPFFKPSSICALPPSREGRSLCSWLLCVPGRACCQAYIIGAWSPARYYFRKVLALQPDDGPSLALLEYMQEYEAPVDWKGCRGLLEK